jgi:hypothetical protein
MTDTTTNTAGEEDDDGEVQFKKRHPFPDEEFQEFREQVENLKTQAQEMCEAVQYGYITAPDPLGTLYDLTSSSQVLSELAAAILEDVRMEEKSRDDEEEEPAS